MRRLLLFLVTALAASAQPSVSEITFKNAMLGVYPHGEPIKYTGTLQSFTAGTGGAFGCGATAGPEPNTVWIRITYGLIQGSSYLFPGEHTGCVGTKLRIDGQDYPISVKLQVVEAAAVTTTNNAGVADSALPHCNDSHAGNPRFFIHGECQEADRRPGGNSTLR